MAVKRYTYKEVDDWLLTELQTWEERAETFASRLNAMSDDDPTRGPITQLWQDQERIIDVIGMLRVKFSVHDRLLNMDASHDLKKEVGKDGTV